MSRIIVVGMLIFLVIGCSEKQKEADRLAADLKAKQAQKSDTVRDTISNAETQVTHDSTLPPNTPTSDSATSQVDSSDQSTKGEVAQTQPSDANPPLDSSTVAEQRVRQDQTQQQTPESTATAEPIMPPRPIDDGYVVQIASTPDPAEAKDITARFVGYGYPAFPQAAQVNGAVWYRVRVGPYATSSEATAVLNELVAKYQVPGWVAKHK